LNAEPNAERNIADGAFGFRRRAFDAFFVYNGCPLACAAGNGVWGCPSFHKVRERFVHTSASIFGSILRRRAVRVVIAILLIVYLIGVGVELAPSVWSGWSTGNSSLMLGAITRRLPEALAWPVLFYRSIAGGR
jgi:hypothetical protein